MKLKEYQERTLKETKVFVEQLAFWRGKARDGEDWLFDFAEKAWDKAEVGRTYLKKTGWGGRCRCSALRYQRVGGRRCWR
jgi:hypothetical protein